jgi:hypothetical protein
MAAKGPKILFSGSQIQVNSLAYRQGGKIKDPFFLAKFPLTEGKICSSRMALPRDPQSTQR